MKRLLATVALAAVVSCGTLTPANQALLNDGQLAVAALTAINQDAVTLGAPLADTTAITLALAAASRGLSDLQAGLTTPVAFATALQGNIATLAPTILQDLKANATITTGVTLLTALLPLIAADVQTQSATAPPPTAQAQDVRGELHMWLAR